MQHPWVHRTPGGMGEQGVIHGEREHPSPGVSWQPQAVLGSCAGAVGLQEGAVPLCNPCKGGLFVFSWLADPGAAPASPSLRVTAGQGVPVWDVPFFPQLLQRDTGAAALGGAQKGLGRGLERVP